jgi:hypothetical protein
VGAGHSENSALRNTTQTELTLKDKSKGLYIACMYMITKRNLTKLKYKQYT